MLYCIFPNVQYYVFRFPNVLPGQEFKTGDHFMSLLPVARPKTKYKILSKLYNILFKYSYNNASTRDVKLLQNNDIYRRNRARNILNTLHLESKSKNIDTS